MSPMPDPTLKTVSASQVPALFGHSPYLTRWQLWQHFKNRAPIDPEENERMTWGKRLQPVILAGVAEALRIDVIGSDEYVASPRGVIGATIDGFCHDPQRGLGVVECKNVDWLVWRDQWTETAAPPHVELQLQTQLAVAAPDGTMPSWGLIAALVGGNELRLYEREPYGDTIDMIQDEAGVFLDAVRDGQEPPLTGEAKELPTLAWLYPSVEERKILGPEDVGDLAQAQGWIAEYLHFSEQRRFADKATKELQAKILGLTRAAGGVRIPGFRLQISKSEIKAATIERKAHVRTTIRGERFEEEIDSTPGVVRQGQEGA